MQVRGGVLVVLVFNYSNKVRYLLEMISWTALEFWVYLKYLFGRNLSQSIGKLHFELAPSEKSFDNLILLLWEEELTPAYNLDDLKVCKKDCNICKMLKDHLNKFEQLGTVHINKSSLPVHRILCMDVNDVVFYVNSLLLDERRLSIKFDRLQLATGNLWFDDYLIYLKKDTSTLKAIPLKKILHCLEVSR